MLRHGSFGCGSLEEVGQTNAPTVGPNMLFALQKGDVDARGLTRFMAEDLRKLGFKKVAGRLEPFVEGLSKDSGVEAKEALWRQIANEYTREENPCLYRQLNRAIRDDGPEVRLWAGYIGALLFSGNPYEERELAVVAPPDARMRVPLQVYRGFAMDPSMLGRYKKGRAFFWQAFVSTSVEEAPSVSFAQGNASGSDVAVLFHIELPRAHYQGSLFWCYSMEGVSAFPGEREVLVMPYTRFICTEEPVLDEDEDLWRVRVSAMGLPLSTVLDRLTVWLDPRGFGTGANYELAKAAFVGGLPRFRLAADEADSSVPGSLNGLALFTQPAAALMFIVEELVKWEATCFRFVVHSSCSAEFLEAYFSADTVNPCEVLVVGEDVEHWKRYWSQHSHVQVTNDSDVVRGFLRHTVYDFQKGEMVPFVDYGFLESQVVWYPWRRVRGGTIYGGVGAPSHYIAAPFDSVRVPLPDDWAKLDDHERLRKFVAQGTQLVCMRPFNLTGLGAAPSRGTAVAQKADKMLAVFQQWDANADGFISKGELERILASVGVAPGDISAAFADADANGDGKVDYEEFVKWIYGVAPVELRQSLGVSNLAHAKTSFM